MFHVHDYIFYGSAGVHEITDIGTPDFAEADEKYYVLHPIFGSGTTYLPVTATGIRPVISKDEALQLIDSLPTMPADDCNYKIRSVQEQESRKYFQSHQCSELLRLVKSLHVKQLAAQRSGRRFGQVDDRYLHRAEDLVFGEFAVALGIPKDDVKTFIDNRLGAETEPVS